MSWEAIVLKILEAETIDIIELAKIAGADPRTFYVGANLTGVDLRGQNLAGIDFTDTDMQGAIFDHQTIIDPQFDPRDNESAHRRSISVSRKLYYIIRIFEEETNYTYSGWAIKRLLEIHFTRSSISEDKIWLNALDLSTSLRKMIDQQGAHKFSLKMDDEFYDAALAGFQVIRSRSKSLRMAIFVGAMKYWHIPAEYVAEAPSVIDIFDKIPLRPRAASLLQNYRLIWTENSPRTLI